VYDLRSYFNKIKIVLCSATTLISNAAFVDALYQNVLSRGADAGGVAYWNDVLNKQLTDRASVLVEFTQLPEFVGISAANTTNGYWVV
jgi:hypothetical protein